jgi:hypothetical protein
VLLEPDPVLAVWLGVIEAEVDDGPCDARVEDPAEAVVDTEE